MYGDKYIKTKTKSYGDMIIQIFKVKKVLEENVGCACLSVILNSVVKTGKKYYLQTFLEKCKYEIKK